jgi:4-hydroxy-2-oxoheptanedioate aldolase
LKRKLSQAVGMTVYSNNLKARIVAGDPSVSMSIRLISSPAIIMAARSAGFHALYIDLEHGALSGEDASKLCLPSLSAGITPLVRIGTRDTAVVSRVLEHGAQGVIVPRVDSAEELEPLLNACRFPPIGGRSTGGISAHAGYRPGRAPEVGKAIERETLFIVMLESEAAVANADSIARMPGVDMIMLGSNDFLMAAGIPGDYASPLLREAIVTCTAACSRHEKSFALAGVKSDRDLIAFAIERGAMLISAGSDLEFVTSRMFERFALVADLTRAGMRPRYAGAERPQD